MSPVLTAVDLFAGGGGLSVGLRSAGFKVVAAVEIEPAAVKTFKANHRGTKVFDVDVRSISGKDLLACSPTGRIDLLAGCPPCQGFSSLTSKYKAVDPRNELVEQVGRLVRETTPSVVMMENVPGLAKKGSDYFKPLVVELQHLGYLCHWKVLQVADYGVPQRRRRLVLLAGKGFNVDFPRETHSGSDRDGLRPWRTVEDAISGMPRPIRLPSAIQKGGPQSFNWHVIRDISSKNISRLKYAKPGRTWRSIRKELRPTCHQDHSAGFVNAYGRMSWDEPSPTITSGCATLSKGRFGHPTLLRTISVREAALLQTFPAKYKFKTEFIDKVTAIIGNALPCDFAAVLAKACKKAIKSHCLSGTLLQKRQDLERSSSTR